MPNLAKGVAFTPHIACLYAQMERQDREQSVRSGVKPRVQLRPRKAALSPPIKRRKGRRRWSGRVW